MLPNQRKSLSAKHMRNVQTSQRAFDKVNTASAIQRADAGRRDITGSAVAGFWKFRDWYLISVAESGLLVIVIFIVIMIASQNEYDYDHDYEYEAKKALPQRQLLNPGRECDSDSWAGAGPVILPAVRSRIWSSTG